MNMIDRSIVSLANNSNWKEFIAHLEDLKLSVVQRMIDCRDTVELQRLQGRAQQLNDILELTDARRADAEIKQANTKIKPNLGGF